MRTNTAHLCVLRQCQMYTGIQPDHHWYDILLVTDLLFLLAVKYVEQNITS